eukprot:2588181-Alexandrium_andersonii.AAC.1
MCIRDRGGPLAPGGAKDGPLARRDGPLAQHRERTHGAACRRRAHARGGTCNVCAGTNAHHM